MGGWLLIAIAEDIPVLLSAYDTWAQAQRDGNKFLQQHNIPGKFLDEPDPDEDQILECDSAAFTGSVGIYDMTGKPPGWSSH
jgi:hypothetical protein